MFNHAFNYINKNTILSKYRIFRIIILLRKENKFPYNKNLSWSKKLGTLIRIKTKMDDPGAQKLLKSNKIMKLEVSAPLATQIIKVQINN